MENVFTVEKVKKTTTTGNVKILLEKLTNIEIALTTEVGRKMVTALEERPKITEDQLKTRTPSQNENKCIEDLSKVIDEAMDSRIIELDEV